MVFRLPIPLIALALVCFLAGCASHPRSSVRSRSTPSALSHSPSALPKEPSRATTRVNRLDERQHRVIQAARSFSGTPYRWGGTTRGGMDCSGLLMVSFQEAGLPLPRTSAEQSKVGRLISIRELRPGDLVFFATQGKYNHKVTHVGMVTEIRSKDDVQFIHASTKLGVIESNIFSDYYRRAFVKARRPF